jgi:lysophospholipase L1-like esterase
MRIHGIVLPALAGFVVLAACSTSSNDGGEPRGDAPAGGDSSGGGSTSSSSGVSAGSSSGGANSSSGGGSVDGGSGGSDGSPGSDPGATSVPCGATQCGPPSSCCRAASATATPSCVTACTGTQVQLCVTDANCQSSGTVICRNGVCFDPGPGDASVAGDGAVSRLDGGIAPPATDAGNVPTGYPVPTTANRAECQTVPLGQGPGVSPGFCPGGGPGPVCIECLFGGSTYDTSTAVTTTATATAEAGNYVVTVDLGGATAGDTYVTAEANRGLLATTKTAAGQTTEYSFVVDVRPREGQPQEAVANGYPGLDLFFSGTNPQVSAIGFGLVTAATKPITVYIASDSTACDQTSQAFAGWGQALPEYFAPPIEIANYADSGESSSSFKGALKWQAIIAHWVPGDWVLIQFGHNDGGVADSVVQTNLESYVTQAIAAQVTPVLISPPARVQITNGVEGSQSSLHAAAAQAAAAAEKVAYIDLTALSTAWYNSLGSQAAALKFHANDSDATHTNMAGAVEIAGLVTSAMKSQNIPLAKYLR